MRKFFYIGIVLLFSSSLIAQTNTNNANSKAEKPKKSFVDRLSGTVDRIGDAFSGTSAPAEPTPIKNGPSSIQKTTDLMDKTEYARWSAALQLGMPITLFDIPQAGFNYQIGLHAKYALGHVLSLRADLNTGLFQGAYSGTKSIEKLDKDYDNQITTLTFNTVWNIGTIDFRRRNPNTTLYGMLGAGLLLNDARRLKPNADNVYLKYTGTALVVPVGFGAKYKLNDQWDLGAEFALNMVENDQLDCYAPFPNNGFSDFFVSTFVSASYKFNVSKEHPNMDWMNPVSTMYSSMDKIAKDNLLELKKDADGDGIPDILDQEPNSKAGYKVDLHGVVLDSDNDGIPDTDDADPYGFQEALKTYFPAESYNKGESVKAYRFNDSIPEDDFIYINDNTNGLPLINFEPNKYDLHVQHYPLLNRIAKIMMLDTAVSLAIIGHADNNKPDMTQINIAEKRALAVKRQLNKIFEVPEERMLIFSVRDPFVSKYRMKTEGLNRKVEFRLIREDK